jgi:hypothetical protein
MKQRIITALKASVVIGDASLEDIAESIIDALYAGPKGRATSLHLWPAADRCLPDLIRQAGSQSAAINQAIIDSWWLRRALQSEAVREAADRMIDKGRNDPAA